MAYNPLPDEKVTVSPNVGTATDNERPRYTRLPDTPMAAID